MHIGERVGDEDGRWRIEDGVRYAGVFDNLDFEEVTPMKPSGVVEYWQ
jgi:hypothetical protein